MGLLNSGFEQQRGRKSFTAVHSKTRSRSSSVSKDSGSGVWRSAIVTEHGNSNVPTLPDATQLSLERTKLAYERTLLAWTRTAVALISFGFTVHKFFQYLHESGQAVPKPRLLGPREFALSMIGIGLMALVLATLEHRRNLNALRSRFGYVSSSLAGLFSGLVGALGVAGFLTVVLKE